jgi:hypothetical protein
MSTGMKLYPDIILLFTSDCESGVLFEQVYEPGEQPK